MQHQQNASRFATQTPTSSWRAGSRPAVVPAPVRPASNFHAPGNEEAWTQYDGLGPVSGGRDLNRNWRNTGSATGNGNGNGNSNGRSVQSAQTSTHMPQGRGQPRSQFQAPPPKRGGRYGPAKGGDRNRSPQRGGIQKQRERSPTTLKPSGTRELIDENYLQRNFQPLDKEEYKMAPNTLFTNPKGFLWDFKGMSAKSSFLSVRGGSFRCTVILTLPNRQKVEAIGESENKVRSFLRRLLQHV